MEEHTVGNRSNESVYGRGAVEEHAGRHGLLPHEVTGRNDQALSEGAKLGDTLPKNTGIGSETSYGYPYMIVYTIHLLLVRGKLSR